MHVALALAAMLAVSPRWAFEDAYDNVEGGDWYMGIDNETAQLAWGESYVLWSLMAMARSTEHPMYVDRMARHIDALLAQRDDARGVADYRGVSGACWRNTSYQDGGEPYCYAVHSGMLAYPIADLAAFVATWRHRDALAYDGETFAAKAGVYAEAAIATAAYHDDEWNDAGYYVFRGDATFLAFAGKDQPLNQSNAMGLALLALHDLTGEAAYLERAMALAKRMRAMMTASPSGGLVWNYWGGPYKAPGEDISHAALNVEFAVQAARRGVVFTEADLDKIATTFLEHVYIDDSTFSDFIGGGGVNDPGYRAQIGRWLALTPVRGAIYAAVHDAYQRDYPAAGVGSGSLLLGWANLAAFEPRVCPHFFYPHDWQDQGESMQATAYGANVLTIPPDLGVTCRVPLHVLASRRVVAAQWDGEDMHRVAEWQPGPDFAARSVAYEPRWPLVYFEGGVLFEFQDDFNEAEAVRVEHPVVHEPPTITSQPPTTGEPGVPLEYVPAGAGDPPFWWSLREGPVGLAVDPGSGVLTFTPMVAGDYLFELALENDLGEAVQAFTVHVSSPSASTGEGTDTGSSGDEPTPTTGDETEESDTMSAPTSTGDGSAGSTDAPDPGETADTGGCGCRGGDAPGLASLLGLGSLLRRRRATAQGGRRAR